MPKIVDADDRRELVADAVFAVIARQGIAHASLRTVAAAAGLALGSVRHYFDNQAELMDFAFRVNSERIHVRALDLLQELEAADLPATADALVAACTTVLTALLPQDDPAEAIVHMEFMLMARTDPGLQDAARDDFRATGAVVGRVLLQLLDSPLVAGTPDALEEAQRLMALLDGLGLRMVLQPEWSPATQGTATLARHLHSLLAR